MNFLKNKNTLLLIIGEKELPEVASFCHTTLSEEGTKIYTATTAVDGIFAFFKFAPCIVIIDDTLPDMRGSSVCSILRDSARSEDLAVNIFFIGDSSSYLFRTFANFFFQKPLQFNLFGNVLKEFFYRRKIQNPLAVQQIGSSVLRQRSELPKTIHTKKFVVSNVFSAFYELSGDGLDYWLGKNKSDLYGFIFDISGHDILAYTSTSQFKGLLKISFDLYEKGLIPSLGKVLHNVNNDLFTALNGNPSPVAAVLFHISFEDNTLYYTPAGMPCLYVDYGEGFTLIKMRNPVIGGFPNVDYENFSLPLGGVERIMFSSDGLSELMTLEPGEVPPTELAKHDDVSAIIVSIKRD